MRHTEAPFVGLTAVVAAIAAIATAGSGSGGVQPTISAGDPRPTPATTDFATLSAARSNRCNLSAQRMRRMPASMRLQGSCCFPMDEVRYREQLRGLRHYADLRGVIPSNPYDVPVALAKRLLHHRSIPLTDRERAAYAVAVKRSETGPCCCHCWRWQAFKGQAHNLLHRRHFSGAQLARAWDLEQGCGGPAESRT